MKSKGVRKLFYLAIIVLCLIIGITNYKSGNISVVVINLLIAAAFGIRLIKGLKEWDFLSLLKINNLSVWYVKDTLILDNLNLEIEKGDILGVLGKNGEGKTTLINTIVGLHKDHTFLLKLEDVYKCLIYLEINNITNKYKTFVYNSARFWLIFKFYETNYKK